jgi:hypothetical protein
MDGRGAYCGVAGRDWPSAQNGDSLAAPADCAAAQIGDSSLPRGAYRGGSGGTGGGVSAAGVDRLPDRVEREAARVAFLRGLYRLLPESDTISLFPSRSRPKMCIITCLTGAPQDGPAT